MHWAISDLPRLLNPILDNALRPGDGMGIEQGGVMILAKHGGGLARGKGGIRLLSNDPSDIIDSIGDITNTEPHVEPITVIGFLGLEDGVEDVLAEEDHAARGNLDGLLKFHRRLLLGTETPTGRRGGVGDTTEMLRAIIQVDPATPDLASHWVAVTMPCLALELHAGVAKPHAIEELGEVLVLLADRCLRRFVDGFPHGSGEGAVEIGRVSESAEGARHIRVLDAGIGRRVVELGEAPDSLVEELANVGDAPEIEDGHDDDVVGNPGEHDWLGKTKSDSQLGLLFTFDTP